MSFTRFNNAEGQASGTTVTVANSGGQSGYAVDSVSGGAALTFDNSQFFAGAQSYKMVTSSTTAYFTWNVPGGGTTYVSWPSIYSRFYVQWLTSAFTNAGLYFLQCTGSASSVYVTSGKLVAAIGATTTSGVTALAGGTWYRVEVQSNFSNSTPSTVIRLYDASGTLLETITATGSAISSKVPATVYLGSAGGSTTGTMWIDQPAISDQGWIGTATSLPISKANNSAGGTNGVTVSIVNSGGASGDAFDYVTTSPSGNVLAGTIRRTSHNTK